MEINDHCQPFLEAKGNLIILAKQLCPSGNVTSETQCTSTFQKTDTIIVKKNPQNNGRKVKESYDMVLQSLYAFKIVFFVPFDNLEIIYCWNYIFVFILRSNHRHAWPE